MDKSVLLETLNTYAKEIQKTGNVNMLKAMGRIIERLEEQGYKVYVNENTKEYDVIQDNTDRKSCKGCQYLKEGYDEDGCYKLKCYCKHPKGKTIYWAFDLLGGLKGSERANYKTPGWCSLKNKSKEEH